MITKSCVLFGFIGLTLASTLGPILMPSGCTQNGKTYKIGENFKPTACEDCFCSQDGRVVCAIIDCFFTMCADAVHDPSQCCATCPNGINCRHKDGTIITKGDTYKPDNNTVCTCENHFGPPQAICLVKPVDPVLIDPANVA